MGLDENIHPGGGTPLSHRGTAAMAGLLTRFPALLSMRREAGGLLRHAAGVVRELRSHDELVYSEISGELTAAGGPFVLHYLGRRRFAHDFLTFFERQKATPLQTFRTHNSTLRFLISRTGLQACPPGVDLLVVDQFLLPESLSQTPTTFSPFFNAHLPIEKTLEAQLGRVRSKGHRRKLAAVLKDPPVWRKSHDLADFDAWYSQMYQPFVKLRFGDDGTVVSHAEMAKIFARSGHLLLLEEGGRAVSGALMYTSRGRPNSLGYWKYAFADAEKLSPNEFGERNARTEAMVLTHTVAAGFTEIDFGLTRSCPSDGIFTHKRRVGCNFRLPEGAPRFALHFANGARAKTLQRTPLLLQGDEKMVAWLGHHGDFDFAARARLRDALAGCAFDGLHDVQIFCDDAAGAAERLQAQAATATAELGCPVQLQGM